MEHIESRVERRKVPVTCRRRHQPRWCRQRPDPPGTPHGWGGARDHFQYRFGHIHKGVRVTLHRLPLYYYLPQRLAV